MKTLPVGVSKTKWGYRLNRTINGKKYNFSSFQNIDHALRVNECIDIIAEDLRKAQAKEGVVSVQQVQEMIVENSVSDMEEITRLIDQLDADNKHIMGLLTNQIESMTEILNAVLIYASLPKESLWNRIKGRFSEWGK